MKRSRQRLEPFVLPDGRGGDTARVYDALDASRTMTRYPPFDQDRFEERYYGGPKQPVGTKDTLDAMPVRHRGYGSPGSF